MHVKTSQHTGSRQLLVSSSAAARLSAARHWLGEIPHDAEVLVLAPHWHATDEFGRTVVAEGGSRFGIQRFTPSRLASRLAGPELARRGFVAGTSLSLAAVVTRAIDRVLNDGGAGRFTAVGRRPGFPHAVVRTFEELRSAGVSARDLSVFQPGDPGLVALLEAVEQELDRMKIADRAEIFEIAIACIADEGAPGGGMPLLLLDLPFDVELESRLVAALALRAPRVFALAAEGDRRAIDTLEKILGVSALRMPATDTVRSLSRLQHHLFEESAPAHRPLDDSVSLASWPGEARECIEIARRLRTEAANGVPFDRMAVLLRSPNVYRARVAEALRRASIPAWFARGATRPDPSGRAILALLACAAEGLSARRFSEYLSLAQVPEPGEHADSWVPPEHDLIPVPDAIKADRDIEHEGFHAPFSSEAATIEGTLRAPWRWERLLVDAAVIGGQERWRRRLDGFAEEIRIRCGTLEESDARTIGLKRVGADLEHLREFALPLIERLAALPREASWDDWLTRLRELAAVAIRQPSGVLAVLAELQPLGSIGPVELATVQHVLAPRLRDLTVLPESRPHGAVFVAPVELARGLEFDVVFVPGLAEKLFPQRIVQDPLLPDNARAVLRVDGLATQESRVAAERLGFRLAAGAAKKHLSLSWPRSDVENARPRTPSFYGLEAMRAAEGRLPGFDELMSRSETGAHARLGWPAPERPEDAIDDTEYDLAVLARLKNGDPAASTGAAAYLLGANTHLARALRARGRRWLKRWTPADGLVDPDRETLDALACHRMGARSFSPTVLESFAACPYRFLLQAIHRLQPREQIEALETMDPLTRGALIHEIQFRVLTALRDGGLLPLDPARLEIVFDRLDAAVTNVAQEYQERLAPAIGRVWEDAVNAIRFDLREWLRRAAENSDGWMPYRFELSFGLPERVRRVADSASVVEPVRVLDGVLLRGSVDLVEQRPDGMLRVTDHKTGKARAPEGALIWGGQVLQPVLYALATEALLGSPVESGRLHYCTADGDFTETRIALDEVARAHAKTALGVIGRAIEQGFLPAAPVKDACRRCDYRTVCGPHEESRTSRKPANRLADLKILRDLR
jgi:ATP-dependent helicase/nuclease subunit B